VDVGDIVAARGFFTKAHWLRMRSSEEIERRIGYGPGRLADGWWLLFLIEMPAASDFEVRGYSHFSGGVVEGHLPMPPDPRTTEQRLRDDGYNLANIKRNLLATVFRLEGASRLAKVKPVRGGSDYPPGEGIEQWTLIREKPFKVAAFIGPGQRYEGLYV
jgi:hypothetical protein